MNKNLQDLAWSVLPKEFKEEVKFEYHRIATKASKEGYDLGFMHAHEGIFGLHNLTSDSEGEEMLTVSRKEVMNHFREACLDRIYYSNDSKDYAQATGRKIMLVRLFGKDKCLPDDKADEKVDEKVDEKNSPNADSSEQKPPEPKYHKGEKVRYNGHVYEVEGLVGKNRYALKGLNFDLDEDMIEPCTEQTEGTTTVPLSGLNADEIVVTGPAHVFNSNLPNEHRLNIAAIIMGSIIQSGLYSLAEQYRKINIPEMAKLSTQITDALIEVQKGECK